jgi:hypothetical protein
MAKQTIVKSALELANEEAFHARLNNPVEAWSITKWYAKCSECETDNEVSPQDGFLAGARTTQACNACGVRFVFRISQ